MFALFVINIAVYSLSAVVAICFCFPIYCPFRIDFLLIKFIFLPVAIDVGL